MKIVNARQGVMLHHAGETLFGYSFDRILDSLNIYFRVIIYFSLASLILGCRTVNENQTTPVTTPPSITVTIPLLGPGPTVAPFQPETKTAITVTPADVDPLVDIEMSQTLYHVGDLITITGIPREVENPYYSLVVRDEGVQDAVPLAEVTAENQLTTYRNRSRVLEFVSAKGESNLVTFVLRAKGVGTTTVTIGASGAVHTGNSGANLELGASGDVVIVVEK
jgi:hypothetical protein